MKRIHIVGRKNSGKTTLIVELVRELTRRGHRVGTIKHTHHDHELDTPGKDSHQHRQAGSMAVGILSPQMNAVFWPASNPNDDTSDSKDSSDESAAQSPDRYSQFDSLMDSCDLVLVEGDSSTSAPKIEVYRAEVGFDSMAISDPSILAVVTDDPVDVKTAKWSRGELSMIVKKIESEFDLIGDSRKD